MLVSKPYIRENAVNYARKFAFAQNPNFANFAGIGGNCTNFVSQCIYAGSCEMNYTPVFGWYFISLNERSPSWTGVEYFYNFITENAGVGPYGKEVGIDELEIGDVIQLGKNDTGYYHTLLVVGFDGIDTLVAAQTDNAYGRPLSTYNNDYARYLKILGVRFEMPDNYSCYERIFSAEPITPPPPQDTEEEETPQSPAPQGDNGM